MLFQRLIGAVVLGASAWQQVQALEHDIDSPVLETRQSGFIATTGITNNGIKPRLELRTMQREQPDMFNVFLLGLKSFMAVDQSDPLSFYQIAGIHGRPYAPWDGVGSSPGFGGGYCTHTSNLFLPWHRPYIALIEQQLYQHVQDVAQSFPEGALRDRYVAAAQDWRIPYWDWAAAPPCVTCKAFPSLMSEMYTTVTTPTGNQTIVNPLYRYDFHPVSVSDMVYNPFATWNSTRRFPTSWDANATSQNDRLNGIFVPLQPNLRDRLYNLFTAYGNFSQFGDEAWISSSSVNADSMESLHDVIHSSVGNNGHMTYLDFAAFDPVFWMHHVMVDRSFALWQAVHPDSYVEPLAAVGATFTYPAGTINDVNSPLIPFFKDTAGTNWTSADVTNTSTFGYTYPELMNGADANSVRAAINKLYGNTAGSASISANVKRAVSAGMGMISDESKFDPSHQYVCNIVSQKFGLNGSYTINIFLGKDSSDSTGELVGTQGVFSNLGNSMHSMDLKITGTVPLTTALAGKVSTGELKSLKPAHVEKYLRDNMHWKVQMADGTDVDLATVPDLSVAVIRAKVTPATCDTDFPVWGHYADVPGATEGKVGGYNPAFWAPCNENNGAAQIVPGPSATIVDAESSVASMTSWSTSAAWTSASSSGSSWSSGWSSSSEDMVMSNTDSIAASVGSLAGTDSDAAAIGQGHDQGNHTTQGNSTSQGAVSSNNATSPSVSPYLGGASALTLSGYAVGLAVVAMVL